ncbi:MAG: RNA polymerase sigma factor [Caulobacteraceae bacterium]
MAVAIAKARRQAEPEGDDSGIARRILAGDAAAAERLIAANNQRLFRTAWSILLDRSEAEEAVQEAYVKAFAALARFRGDSSLSTWLTRIVANVALERRRGDVRRRRAMEADGVAFADAYRETMMRGSWLAQSPEQAVMRAELARLIEAAIERLPEPFRPVFVLREIEGLSVAEIAEALGVAEATVRTRVHRAKRQLKADLEPQMTDVRAATLPFAGADCRALTERVLKRLGFS